MKIKIFLTLAALFAIFVSGCSTVEPAKHYGKAPLESFKSAYVVFAKNMTIGGYIEAALARRDIKVNIGPLKDKPKDVAFYVIYADHWNWDVTVYLDSLDVQFMDNSNGQMIASGSFKNGAFHTFPDPRTKTFEVIDSIYNAK